MDESHLFGRFWRGDPARDLLSRIAAVEGTLQSLGESHLALARSHGLLQDTVIGLQKDVVTTLESSAKLVEQGNALLKTIEIPVWTPQGNPPYIW